MRTFKQFTYYDRLKLEALYNNKTPISQISKTLNFHISTIYRELQKGYYERLTKDYIFIKCYSADKAQRFADYNKSAHGADLKIANDYDFLQFIEDLIVKKHFSPAAALGYIKHNGLDFNTNICIRTLYSYIDKGVFLHLSNKNLLYKGKRKKHKAAHIKKPNTKKGKSIDNRPFDFYDRSAFGHWELDSVIGKRAGSGNTLLVLTERKTNKELIFRAKDKSIKSTVQIFDRIEKRLGATKFRKIFRTITCDNGSEWDGDLIERSSVAVKKRTEVYFCHPYSSWERGSNEKQNQFIRRFIPKGDKIEKYSDNFIKEVEGYINRYPRSIYDWFSSEELFNNELHNIGIKNFL